MRRFLILALVAAILALPALAMAQEPYSSSTTTTIVAGPTIKVAANGLEVQLTASGITGSCTWDFGDGSTGEGNPATHTYAADGTYAVAVNCSGATSTRSITVATGLSWTGFGVVPFGIAIGILVLLGATALAVSRKVRANR